MGVHEPSNVGAQHMSYCQNTGKPNGHGSVRTLLINPRDCHGELYMSILSVRLKSFNVFEHKGAQAFDKGTAKAWDQKPAEELAVMGSSIQKYPGPFLKPDSNSSSPHRLRLHAEMGSRRLCCSAYRLRGLTRIRN